MPDRGSSWSLSDWWSPPSPTGPCICTLGSSAAVPTMEGPLRRKTLLKEGRRPAVSADLPLCRGSRGSREGPGLHGKGLTFHICKLG